MPSNKFSHSHSVQTGQVGVSIDFYSVDCANDSLLKSLAEHCIKAWRLEASAFWELITPTGFQTAEIQKLTQQACAMLPNTPADNKDITKSPYITDLTEMLCVEFVKEFKRDLVMPFPRVFHKELSNNQHKGIDIIGYETVNGQHKLYIIEIMASVEAKSPPGTEKEHFTQLHKNTLNDKDKKRLMKELTYIHDESDQIHKDILNGFIVKLLQNDINDTELNQAVSMLVRPAGKNQNTDFDTFKKKASNFSSAHVKATVSCFGLNCNVTFAELMNKVKTKVEDIERPT